MFVPLTIAILNMWRGRGYDITPRLNKTGFLVFGNALLLSFYSIEVAVVFNLVFGFIFCLGTGEMMQAIHGKQQTPKWQTAFIYKLISKVTSLQGRLCGVLFNTVLGAIQCGLASIFGFNLSNIMFLYNGIIIYLLGVACKDYLGSDAKAWQACEYVLGFMWVLLIINATK